MSRNIEPTGSPILIEFHHYFHKPNRRAFQIAFVREQLERLAGGEDRQRGDRVVGEDGSLASDSANIASMCGGFPRRFRSRSRWYVGINSPRWAWM